MKTMKRYTGLYYAILAALFVITLGIYFSKADILLNLPLLNWGAILLAIVIIFSPRGSKRLVSSTNQADKLPLSQWLGNIINLQVTLFLLYFAITQFSHYLAIEGEAPKSLLTDSLREVFFSFGLYPWPLIAIFAISFGLSAYVKGKDSYLDDITLLPQKSQFEAVNVTIKGTARALTIGAIAVTLVILTLIFTSITTQTTHIASLTGFTGASMGAAFLMLFLCIKRENSHWLNEIIKQRPLLGTILTVLIWVIVLSLAAVIVRYTNIGAGELPKLLNPILNKGWALHFQLFSHFWWLMFTPISAIFIARFSYGYSLRAVIIATLALPALIAALLKMAPMVFAIDINQAPLWLVQTAAALGFFSLMGLIYQKNHLPMVISTYIPSLGNIKPRNEEIYRERLKKMCGVVFYLFIPAGFFITSLLVALLFIPVAVIIIAVYLQLINYKSVA